MKRMIKQKDTVFIEGEEYLDLLLVRFKGWN